MKILLVGGSFDNDGGRESGLVKKLHKALKNIENVSTEIYNGGYYKSLEEILSSTINYDVVFWMANVPNDYPKIRDVKEVAPHVMLVSSKRNDNDKYPFKELVERTLAMKANLTLEFKKMESGIFNIMVFDPLGSVWYEGQNINNAVLAVINRLSFLMSITRKATIKSEDNVNLKLNWYFDRFKLDEKKADGIVESIISDEYLDLITEYAKVFQNIMGVNNKSVETAKMSPPQVFRCSKGMPSFRSGNLVVVSKRAVFTQFLTKEDFVATYMENGELFYYGDDKPSVDTPNHIKLYENLKNINFIIHSHNYIDGAPFTNVAIPCGAIEESDEVIKAIKESYGSLDGNRYMINLKGHGSFLLGSSIDDLKGANYIGRSLPERM